MKKKLFIALPIVALVITGGVFAVNSQSKPVENVIAPVTIAEETEDSPQTAPKAPEPPIEQKTVTSAPKEEIAPTEPQKSQKTLGDFSDNDIQTFTMTDKCQELASSVVRITSSRWRGEITSSIENGDSKVIVNDAGVMACVYNGTRADLGL